MFEEWDVRCKVYVGNLGNNASKTELESVFSNYGPLKNVWVARNPPGFAFIEFQDPRGKTSSLYYFYTIIELFKTQVIITICFVIIIRC